MNLNLKTFFQEIIHLKKKDVVDMINPDEYKLIGKLFVIGIAVW